MTREEFNSLSFKNKLKTILNSGKFIDAHISSVGDTLITNFYRINLFHVEVVYGNIGTSVQEIKSYKTGSKMDRYIP